MRVHSRSAVLLFALWAAQSQAEEAEYVLKLSHHVPPAHHQHSIAFVGWARELAERSNGRLRIDIYPAQQLGPLSQQFNLVRRGDVDIAFVLHGLPSGRFPLVELTHLPLLFESAEQASQVLMALVPEYLQAEHHGVKILYLFGHAPGVIHTRTRPVYRPEDLKGLRIRHPSSVIGDTLRAWGASPAGMAPGEMAQNLNKGVIDGLVIPYDGVLSFRLAPYVRYSTELLSYVNSFGVLMNQDSYDRLPADLQQLIDDTTGMAAAREVGRRWDEMERPGREYMRDNGVEIIELTAEERAVFAKASEHLFEERIAAAEAQGLPAREFMARVRELAEQFRKN
jgi:TRAP-type C4-dicarboxylate transport system substrate-binding protein